MRAWAGLMAAAVALTAGAAAAQTLSEEARRAESLLQAGKPVEALEALDAATDRIWQASPLAFRKALPVASAEGFGIYEPLENPSFRAGETMRVYAEPIGYGYGQRDGMYTISLEADLAIENMKGQVIAEGEDLFAIEVPTHEKNRELNMTLSFELPELKPGDYRVVFTVRDRSSTKTGKFEIPVTIVDGEPAADAAPDAGGTTPTDEPAEGRTTGGTAEGGAEGADGVRQETPAAPEANPEPAATTPEEPAATAPEAEPAATAPEAEPAATTPEAGPDGAGTQGDDGAAAGEPGADEQPAQQKGGEEVGGTVSVKNGDPEEEPKSE